MTISQPYDIISIEKKKERQQKNEKIYIITSTIPEDFEIRANNKDDAMEKFLKYAAFSVTEIKEIEEDE